MTRITYTMYLTDLDGKAASLTGDQVVLDKVSAALKALGWRYNTQVETLDEGFYTPTKLSLTPLLEE